MMPRSQISAPAAEHIRTVVAEAHAKAKLVTTGASASYIPALAEADPDHFGICLAGISGNLYPTGHAEVLFSIQSVSKPFVFALICQALGEQTAREKLGVNSTGLPFNSVLALERTPDGTTNPMVNSGAIAAASLAPGRDAQEKWEFVHAGLSRFAGRTLALNERVFESESATNTRNRAIAKLLVGHGTVTCDPDVAVDVYTRQCSLDVNARDLAVMAATLANGGVNPVTGKPVIDAIHCQHVLAVMVTAGLYETSGDWLYDVGLPGKSGVSGGVIAVAPGRGGYGAFSPRLDASGNSLRGALAAKILSEKLGLNLFASARGVVRL
jgi:glutaminase